MSVFTDLCFHKVCRQNEVERYSGVYQETVENLAEHVIDVMMISYILAGIFERMGEKIDVGLLLEKGLLHDIEEVVTGDIPRTTKYASQDIKESLGDLAVESAYTLLGEGHHYAIWTAAKKGKEGFILQLADFLSVAKKCVVEVKLRNNYSFLKVVKEVVDNLQSFSVKTEYFNSQSCNYIHSLLDETIYELKDIYKEHSHLVSKYKID